MYAKRVCKVIIKLCHVQYVLYNIVLVTTGVQQLRSISWHAAENKLWQYDSLPAEMMDAASLHNGPLVNKP